MGASPDEVVMSGSTTVNLHALVSTFYQPSGIRTKIVADELNFPSDIYALAGQVRLKGLDPKEHLVLVRSRTAAPSTRTTSSPPSTTGRPWPSCPGCSTGAASSWTWSGS